MMRLPRAMAGVAMVNSSSEFFPRISLTGFLGVASDDLSDLFRSSASVWSVGGSLAGPIFTGGRLESQVRVTEAVQRQALVGYLQTIQTAFREVDDALIFNQKSIEEIEAQNRQVSALVNYARLAREHQLWQRSSSLGLMERMIPPGPHSLLWRLRA